MKREAATNDGVRLLVFQGFDARIYGRKSYLQSCRQITPEGLYRNALWGVGFSSIGRWRFLHRALAVPAWGVLASSIKDVVSAFCAGGFVCPPCEKQQTSK